MEKRSEYIEKLEKSLTEYDAKLDKMKAKAALIQGDLKAEYLSQVANLEEKRDEFVVKYGQLKESSGHAWDDIKVGTHKTWSTLEDSFEKVVSRFK